MSTRMPANKSVEKDVLTASRRRCCLCVFLLNRDEVCQGQLAHLNRDRSDSRFANLVFLCLAGCGKSKLVAWLLKHNHIELFYARPRSSAVGDVQLLVA